MENQVEQLNNEGVKFFLNGNFSAAKTKYREALEISPEYPTTLNNLGMVLLQEKKYTEAEKCFKKAIELKENPTYLLNLGHVYANLNQPGKAEDNYLKSIELNPNSLMAWKSLGSLYQFQKKYFHSVKIWKNVIENYSHDPYYKIQLAKDMIALKEFGQALNVLSEAAGQDKYQEMVWYYTAMIHFSQSNFGIAESAIKKALALKPDDEACRILAATIYLGLSQLDKALMHWDYLLKANENNHKVRIDKAVALLANGYRKEALEELNFVISKDKKNVKALFYKALTLVEMKENLNEGKEILNVLKTGSHPFRDKAAGLLEKLTG
jgi:tetratricopeptide (TPR) repeat protein